MKWMLPLCEPTHPARKAWDFVRLLAVLWEGFVSPIAAAEREPALYLALAWPDLIFFFKIPVDFNTRAYTRFGTRTETRKDIFWFRLGPKLGVDLVAAIPVHILAWCLTKYSAPIFLGPRLQLSVVVFALGTFRIVFLFEILDRLWILYQIDNYQRVPTKQTFTLLLALHWFGIPILYMYRISVGAESVGKTIFERYLFMIYFTSSTFIPVGYGDISMKSTDTRLYLILLLAMGSVAYLLWTVSIVRVNVEERLRDNPVSGRRWAIAQYLITRQCGPRLERAIQDWFLFRIRNADKESARFHFDELPPSYRAMIAEKLAGLTMPPDSALFYDLLKAVEVILPPGPYTLHRLSVSADRFFIVTRGEIMCYDTETGTAFRRGPGFAFGGVNLTAANSLCEITCCPGCELLALDLLSVRRIVNASSPFRPALRDAVKCYALTISDEIIQEPERDSIAGNAILSLVGCLNERECRGVMKTVEARQLRLYFHKMFCAALAKVLENYGDLQCDIQEILLHA